MEEVEEVEEGEIIRRADGSFVERQNDLENSKVTSAIQSILRAEFEDGENYNDKSSSLLS